MNHAITTAGLLLIIGTIGGLAVIAFGILTAFAGGMSDAPSEGDTTSKNGCIISVIGIVLMVACLIGLFQYGN